MTETESGQVTARKETQVPLLLGLTGVYCAGKNHVARLLEDRGFKILDVDKLGHRVLELEREVILGRFGWEILGEDGVIDRERLGRRVFGKPEELAALEGIIHPRVNRMIMEWLDLRKGKPCVIHAALLHRSPVIDRLDAVILVRAPIITRLLRARKRDRLSWGQLIKRFRSQKKFAAQYLAQKVDIYTVYNRGYFGFCSRLYRRRLENRIETILSLKGMV